MKTVVKTFIFIGIFAFLSLFAFACKEKDDDGNKEPVLPRISAPKTEYKMIVGSVENLEVNLDYESALQFIYTYDDKTIASVVDGQIRAQKVGETNIVVSPVGFADVSVSIKVVVVNKPTITVTGEDTVYPGWTTKLEASVTCEAPIDEVFTWTSNDESIATIDANGVVTGVKLGVVMITCDCQGYTSNFRIEVIQEPDKLVLDYNGGVTADLYKVSNAVASTEMTAYNGNFWGGYTTNVFLYSLASDPKATFSTRIYIGKNANTGFYEVVGTQFSSASKQPEGTVYVLVISDSHNNAKELQDPLKNIEKGMVVIFGRDDLKSMKASDPISISFYNQELDSYKVEYEESLNSLPTPAKLGHNFLGWYDKDGNKLSKVPAINGITVVTAKWEEIDPVTSLVIDSMVNEMFTSDEYQIVAHVEPSNAYFKDIKYSSSNSDILSVDKTGKLVAKNAGTVVITISDYMKKFPTEITVTVKMIPSIDIKYDGEFDGVLNVGENIKVLPSLIGDVAVNELQYVSSDSSIASVNNGVITAVSEGTAEITISCGNVSVKVGVTVNGLSEEDKVSKVLALIAKNNFSVAETGNVSLYNDGDERYYVTVYGSVNRYLFSEFKLNTDYVARATAYTAGHKTRRAVDTIEFITVHDTATLSGTVADIASNFSSGNTSIHYTVGNDAIYQVVPEEFIAFHAGDGTGSTFEWFDTGVNATDNSKPVFTIVQNGGKYVYACNGNPTSIAVPSDCPNPSNNKLTNLGPTWKIENGKYYMGLTWWSNSYGYIASHGGNNNSIGIEMCVNIKGDIYDTWQRTAKLVADICIRNGLDLSRVQQHNSFSGKNCPQCLISGGYWYDFMKMVELEYELQKNYSDVEISMVSNDPEIVDNTGRVVKSPSVTTTVSYTVTVKCGSSTKTIKLYTVIPGNTTWEKWDGTYAASKIWNNGKFTR